MEKSREEIVKIQKQQAMRNVLIGLSPLILAAIYFFGWRFIAVYLVVGAAGLLSEWFMSKRYGYKITESLFVTATLFALSLPPTIPLWIAAVGIAFGVIFGKMVFGGFGRNIFNPAITARAFVYISFGVPMTAHFLSPQTAVSSFPAGFGVFSSAADSVAAATPLITKSADHLSLLLGNVAGSFGETSAVLILLGGLFIIYKKAANWKTVVSAVVAFLLFQTILWMTDTAQAADPLYALLSGSFIFAAFFMITDPVSSSQSTDIGRIIYGAAFGLLTVLIRIFSSWAEGVTFAILLVNMFAPLLDYLIKEAKKKNKAKRAAIEKGGNA